MSTDDMIPFGTEIDVSGLTIGLDKIEQGLSALGDITTSVSQALTDSLTRVEQSILAVAQSTGGMGTAVETLVAQAQQLNDGLEVVVGQLMSMADVEERTSTVTRTLSDSARLTFEQLQSLGLSAKDAASGVLAFGESANIAYQALQTFDVSTLNAVEQLQFYGATLDQARSSTLLFAGVDDEAAAAVERLVAAEENALNAANDLKLANISSVQTLQNYGVALSDTASAIINWADMQKVASDALNRFDVSTLDAVSQLMYYGATEEQARSSTLLFADSIDVANQAIERLMAEERQAGNSAEQLAARTKASEGGMRGFGDGTYYANRRLFDFGAGIGGFIGTMVGFTIVTRAAEALKQFGDFAITGNIALEKFRQQLTVLVGSGGAADKIVAWSFAFGRTIPFTTTSLQQATVTIASLGLNVEEVMPTLAKIAAAMGVDLPTAAIAFLDAFKENRFLMMQRQLRISKSDLEEFGLVVAKNGHVTESTLLPALERLAAARFPNALTTAMHTFAGEESNLIDLVQQLALAFGKPIFEAFKNAMFSLIAYINQNRDAIWAVATAVGTVLGNAVAGVIGGLGQLAQLFLHNHDALRLLGGVLAGIVAGGIAALVIGIGSLFGEALAILGLFAGLGVVAGFLGGKFLDLWSTTKPLRDLFDTLGAGAQDLARVFSGQLTGAISGVGAAFSSGLGSLFSGFGDTITTVSAPVMAFRGHIRDASTVLNVHKGVLSQVTDFLKGTFFDSFTTVSRRVDDFRGNMEGMSTSVVRHAGLLSQAIGAIAGPFVTVFAAMGPPIRTIAGQIGALFLAIGPAIAAAAPGFAQLAVGVARVAAAIVGLAAGGDFAWMRVMLTVAQALFPVLIMLAGLIAGTLGNALTFLAPYLRQAGAAVATFGNEMATRLVPAIATVAAIIRAVLPVILAIWSAVWPELSQILQGVWNVIIGIIQIAWNLVSGIIKIGLDLLGGNWGAAWHDLQNMLRGVWDGIVSLVTGLIQELVGIVRLHLMVLGAIWHGIWSGLTAIVGTVLHGIQALAQTVWNAIVQGVTNFATMILGILRAGFLLVLAVVTAPIRAVMAVFDLLYHHSYVFQLMVDLIVAHFQRMFNIVRTIWNAVLTFIMFIVGGIVGIVQTKTTEVHTHVQTNFERVRQTIQNVLNIIIGIVSGAWNFLVSVTVNTWNFWVGIIGGVLGRVQTVMNSIIAAIKTPITDLATFLFNAAQNLINMLIAGINSKIQDVKNAAGNLGNAIKDMVGWHSPTKEGPGADSDQWMPNLGNMLVAGLEAQAAPVGAAAAKMADALRKQMGIGADAKVVVGGDGGGLSSAAAGVRTSGFLPFTPNLPQPIGAPVAANAGGIGSVAEAHVHLHIEGDGRFGFDMLDPVSRSRAGAQLAREFAKAGGMQGVTAHGYAGTN